MARAAASLAALLFAAPGGVGAEDLGTRRPERFVYEFPELVTLSEEPFAPPRELASSEAWLQHTKLFGAELNSDEAGTDHEVVRPDKSAMVQDCVQVFQRTAIMKCGRSARVEVLSAQLQPIAGFMLKLYVKVASYHHHFSCAFEPKGTAVAEEGLVGGTISGDALVPEEKKGLLATVIMNIEICQADNASTAELPTDATVGRFELVGGDRSRAPENRHLLERVPDFVASIQSKAAASAHNVAQYSLMDVAPLCFPGKGGRDVVLTQGTCGACWAFAGASAMMATICVSNNGSHSLEGWNKRLEISAQRIMSCNPDNYGCNGGTAYAAQASLELYGPGIASALPYKCGSGSSLNHFEKASPECEQSPWGGNQKETCSPALKNGNWSIGGMYRVFAELQMKQAILDGHALYTAFDVYKNAMWYRGGVYDTTEGAYLGGHAVTSIGFGFEGKKYWLFQNSWDTTWGDNGFMKMLRGVNFVNCESLSFAFRGSANPGAFPKEPFHEAAQSVEHAWQDYLAGFASGDNAKVMFSFGMTLGSLCVCMLCCRLFASCGRDDEKY